jgi:predicted transposase YdaD
LIDHDRLFKELIETFFLDFVDLFLPEVAVYLEKDSISFIDKELFTDVTAGESHEVDLVVKGRFKGKEACFLIHIEAQSSREGGFARRMFRYFARLYDKFDIPVYPVAIFSYDTPLTPEEESHTVAFPDRTVMSFSYRAIQLNRLNWRDFIDKHNPVAAALMSRMRIATEDRPGVKLECLRLLATLRLDPARMRLISGFVDTYLSLTAAENELFNRGIEHTPKEEKEAIMQMTTSWKEEGILEGMQQGMQQEGLSLIIRQLARKLGALPASALDAVRALDLSQLEDLGDALLDFSKREDLDTWLREHGSPED